LWKGNTGKKTFCAKKEETRETDGKLGGPDAVKPTVKRAKNTKKKKKKTLSPTAVKIESERGFVRRGGGTNRCLKSGT